MKLRISERDLAIIHDVARFQLLTTKQIARKHFAGSTANAASNRVSALARAGYLDRVYSYPRASAETLRARPSAIYLFPPKAQKTLQEELERTSRASLFDPFEDYCKTYNRQQTFAQQSLQHELALSDVFLALENVTTGLTGANSGISVAFWERTSPHHPDLTAKFQITMTNRQTQKARQLTVSFNPDGFFLLRYGEKKFGFYFVEIDNDTAKVAKVAEKNAAYIKYNNDGLMRKAAETFLHKHGIDIPLSEKVGFRVLTVTPHELRSANLFVDSLGYEPTSMFHYTTLDRFTEDPFGNIWHRKKEFKDQIAAYKAIEKEKPSVRRKWLQNALDTTPRTSIRGG